MFGFLKRLFSRAPSMEALASTLIRRMSELKPGPVFTYEARLGVIRGSDGSVMSLANLHHDLVNAKPAERAGMIEVFALGVAGATVPDDLETARANLLPALRHLHGLDHARIMTGGDGIESVTEGMQPFSPELLAGVVFDSEHPMAQVTQEQLKTWGLTAEAAMEMAIDNLRRKAAPKFSEVFPGLYLSNYGDFYDGARILLPELPHQVGIAGNPVAMAPNRICLMFTSDRNEQALQAMIQHASQVLHQESRPLGAEMFQQVDGHWRVWIPEGAAGDALRELQLGMRSSDYESQKAALDAAHERAKVDVFVASHTLVRKEKGPLVSYSVLTKNIDTWLPRSDLVMILDPTKEKKPMPKVVEWSVFEREAGHLLEALPYTLPRYRLREHPSDDIVERMAAAAF